jgi:pimeloyl-ACP methyl ester carboxylesterase
MYFQSGSHVTRRTLLATSMATAASSLVASRSLHAQNTGSPTLRPFRVEIPQETIDRILSRLRETRWPDRLDQPDWRYGANWNFMKALVQYWIEGFDWRKAEANLNRYPQYLARVGEYDIHFYYAKGRGPKPVPLILTHGWPGSVVEFLEAIGPLSDPASYGGSPEDAFDVIVPSLPGFGFSSKPKKPIGRSTVAGLWYRLMTELLGYQQFGAQGGDIGALVTAQLALIYKDSVLGVHFNALNDVAGVPPEAEQTQEERAWRRTIVARNFIEFDYAGEHRNKPQTVSFALTDNPLGTAAWIVEKLKGWSDSDSQFETAFTKDQILTNVMIYLVTNTIGTSVWIYRGGVDETNVTGRILVPTAKVSLPREQPNFNPPKFVLERNANLLQYTELPRGGHFAFWEKPQELVEDVRKFFRTLRT